MAAAADNWSRLLASLKTREDFPLLPDPEGSISRFTRPPVTYDKHLAPNLVPRYTKIFDSLADMLVKEAEKKINRMQEQHKDQPPERFIDSEPSSPMQVMAETGVSFAQRLAELWEDSLRAVAIVT